MTRVAYWKLLSFLSLLGLVGLAASPLYGREVALEFDREGRLLSPIPRIRARDKVTLQLPEGSRALQAGRAPAAAHSQSGRPPDWSYTIETRVYKDQLAAQSPDSYLSRQTAQGVSRLALDGPLARGNVVTFDIFRTARSAAEGDLRLQLEQAIAQETAVSDLPAFEPDRIAAQMASRQEQMELINAELRAGRVILKGLRDRLRQCESEISWLISSMDAILEKKAMEEARQAERDLTAKRKELRAAIEEHESAEEERMESLDKLQSDYVRLRERNERLRLDRPLYEVEREGLSRRLWCVRADRERVEALLAKLQDTGRVEEHLHHGEMVVGPGFAAISYSAPQMRPVGDAIIRHADSVSVYLLNVPYGDPADYVLTVENETDSGPEEFVYKPDKMAVDLDLVPGGRAVTARYREVVLPVPLANRGGKRVAYTIRDRSRPGGGLAKGEPVFRSVVSSAYLVHNRYRLGLSYGLAASSKDDRTFAIGKDGGGNPQVLESSRPVLIPVIAVTIFPRGRDFLKQPSLGSRFLPSPMLGFSPRQFSDHFLFGAQWEPFQGFNVSLGGHLFRDEALERVFFDSNGQSLVVGSEPPVREEFRLGVFFGLTFRATVFGTKYFSVI